MRLLSLLRRTLQSLAPRPSSRVVIGALMLAAASEPLRAQTLFNLFYQNGSFSAVGQLSGVDAGGGDWVAYSGWVRLSGGTAYDNKVLPLLPCYASWDDYCSINGGTVYNNVGSGFTLFWSIDNFFRTDNRPVNFYGLLFDDGFTFVNFSTDNGGGNNWNAPGPVQLSVQVGNRLPVVTYGGILRITPVPEPSTYAMLVSGLGVMWLVRRRRSARYTER